jgi:hypothetical protein
MLLGQTLDSMRVWDIRRAIAALHEIDEVGGSSLWLDGRGVMAGNVLYASLFENGVAGLDLSGLHRSHRGGGPTYLNVLRFLDIPATLAMAGERCAVRLHGADPGDWRFASELAAEFGWSGRIDLVAE